MSINKKGITYYKLDSNIHGYQGDITKNCGLRGEEIDSNFNFLRGHDIKTVSFDEDGAMHLTRYNGEILVAKQVETPDYEFSYDAENGILTIIKPNGDEVTLPGFKYDMKIYHDSTITGNGTNVSPFSISNINKTGRYRPAIKLIDYTITDDEGNPLETLPYENINLHDRYVTKEKYYQFGRLFPLSGVKNISDKLKENNSEWHIPSKSEWDEILNTIDCEIPNHDSMDSNVKLGEIAGKSLKAIKYWKQTDDNKILSDDSYGFSIYPVGYCVDRGRKSYLGFGEAATFWTSTSSNDDNDIFVKTFEYDSEKVSQRTWGNGAYLSVRLVKEFNGNNFYGTEEIDGFTFNCVHIPGTNLIWTKENVMFPQDIYDGFIPNDWNDKEDVISYKFYINDWNGKNWDKYELKEGESIVLHNSESGNMHEWTIIDGELIDNMLFLKNEVQKIDIDKSCEHIKLGDNGIYFDGNFGQF